MRPVSDARPGAAPRDPGLAVPAFLALIAEPLFLLADSAIVGHLGTAQLAGLGVASAALLTAAGIFVFLAYGTTSVVARQLGAGDERGAVAAGIDGIWLALGLGAVTAAVVAASRPARSAPSSAPPPAALEQATTYLRISALGIPAMLVILAATGVLRGLQDTRTPLVASVVGFGANIALNLVFVYGLHWGIAGSAWGTVIAQTGMAGALVTVLVRSCRPHDGAAARRTRRACSPRPRDRHPAARAHPRPAGGAARHDLGRGRPRRRAARGPPGRATIWSFLAFALDALAIAAQAITGRALGAGDRSGARPRRPRWSAGASWGGARAAGARHPAALHSVSPPLFTPDPPSRTRSPAALVVVGARPAVSGFVFVLDGVLIGAGDGPWLARAMVVTLAAYLPVILAVHAAGDWLLEGGSTRGQVDAVIWLWLAFTAFMSVRGTLMWMRVRTDRWMVTGATLG